MGIKEQSRSVSGKYIAGELEKYAREHGADLFGIADLTLASDFIAAECPPWVGEFPRAISVGLSLSDFVLEKHGHDEPRETSLYFHHVYEVVTPALDFLAYDLTRLLARKGYKAFAVPGSSPWDRKTIKGVFPHKLAAHLAGLGWIGKNCLLLTEEFGPRIRFVTILTDAPLQAGAPIDRPCGKCHVCIESCPVQAFTGVEFQPDQGRDIRFDALKCMQYRVNHACGVCVSCCPKGKLAANRRRKAKGKSAVLIDAECE